MDQLSNAITLLYPAAHITSVEEDRMRINFTLFHSPDEYHMQVEHALERVAVYRKSGNIWIAVYTLTYQQINDVIGRDVLTTKGVLSCLR